MLALAFHKVAGRGGFGRLISVYEKMRGENSQFSHVEIVFGTYFDPIKNQLFGDCFSADEKDHGTRFKEIVLDTKEWEVVQLRVTKEQWQAAEQYAATHNHLAYDWTAILFAFALPLGKHDADDRFCSEIVTEILQHALGVWPDVQPWKTSPGKLYDLVVSLPEARCNRAEGKHLPGCDHPEAARVATA